MFEAMAKQIVEELVADLTDRKGLDHEWYEIGHEVQEEIKGAWQEIVARAITRHFAR